MNCCCDFSGDIIRKHVQTDTDFNFALYSHLVLLLFIYRLDQPDAVPVVRRLCHRHHRRYHSIEIHLTYLSKINIPQQQEPTTVRLRATCAVVMVILLSQDGIL